jgi:ABC-type Fe3+-hydroxamate transport system substrate-binding protein
MTDALHRWATACSALSSSSRSSRMVFKGIMCFALIVFFVSCRSVSSVESLKSNVESKEVHDSQLSTFDIQHSTLRDSVIYRERTVHDTVYITKEIYRDTHNSSLIARNSAQADTVVDVRVEKEIIKLPPQRYVPKFYKTSTILFYLSLLVMAVIIFIKLKLNLRLFNRAKSTSNRIIY